MGTIGGILPELHFFKTEDIYYIVPDFNGKEKLVLRENASDPIVLKFTPETLTFSSNGQKSSAGKIYEHILEGSIIRSIELDSILKTLENELWICIFKEKSGAKRLLGDIDRGILISESDNVSQALSGGNSCRLSIKFMSRHRLKELL